MGSDRTIVTESASLITGATPYLWAISGVISLPMSGASAEGSMLTYFMPNCSAIVPRTSSSVSTPEATSTSRVVSLPARIAWLATSSCSAVT